MNTRTRGAGNPTSITVVKQLHATIIPTAVQYPLRMRFSLRAPNFWAMKAFTAVAKPSAVV